MSRVEGKDVVFLRFFLVGGAWRFLEVLGVNSLDIQNQTTMNDI